MSLNRENTSHVILHRLTKFRPHRTTHGKIMTSYRFFKMVAIASVLVILLYRFLPISRSTIFGHSQTSALIMKVEMYLHTKLQILE